ncbi:MAG: PEGA domain-containing protein [Balneolaceae bacterium]
MLTQPIYLKIFLLFLMMAIGTKGFSQESENQKGWLKVLVDMERFYLVIDNDLSDPYLLTRGDSIQVKSGKRNIKVVWFTIHDHSFSTTIKADEMNNINVRIASFPEYPRTSYETIVSQTNLFIRTDLNSTVYIDGEKVGKHTVQTLVKPGKRLIHITHPKYGELKKEVEVNSRSVTELDRFNENPSKLPFVLKLLPGAEYLSTKRYKRAATTYAGLGAMFTNLIIQNTRYSKSSNRFNQLTKEYLNAQTSQKAVSLREMAALEREGMKGINRNIQLTYLAGGVLYLISTWDSIRKPKEGYKFNKLLSNEKLQASFSANIHHYYPEISLTYAFN